MTVRIDSSFPGGNIVVEHIDGDDVYVHQELRDTEQDWFYWCFRIQGAAGRTMRFTFTEGRALGVHGPALSVDGGQTWKWLGAGSVDGNTFRCAFPDHASSAMLSFAMPYQESHWQRFAAEIRRNPAVVEDTLCVTPQDRETECMLLRCGDGSPAHRVVITCRHHACEMMANYVLEGLVHWILKDTGAEWLRHNVEFLLVPFVDKDGVEEGDQGKARTPRDHGRDYGGESLFTTTTAIRERIPDWADGRLHVGMDIHCPHIAGTHNDVIYQVGSPLGHIDREQRRFGGILESCTDGPLPFAARDYLPFGEAWNTEGSYAAGRSFARWISGFPGVKLATCIEIPYATAAGEEVNQASARRFGSDLGKGLAEYLRTKK